MKTPICCVLGVALALVTIPAYSADQEGQPRPEAEKDNPNAPEKGPRDGDVPKAGPRDGEGGPKPEGQRNGAAVPAKAGDQKVAKVFVSYDADKDGVVSDEEIVGMMEGKQNSSGRREIRKAVDRADKDNDDVLNFEEFQWWYEVGRLSDDARNR